MKEIWKENEGNPPIVLYEYRRKEQPWFVVGVCEFFENSLKPGLNGFPLVILPEGGLPSGDGREEAEDYVERVRAWWDGYEKERVDYVYREAGSYESERLKTVLGMPVAQVEFLSNGDYATRILLTNKVIHEDGTEEASFADTLVIFGEDGNIEIAIAGNDYEKCSSEEQLIIDKIINEYPDLRFKGP